MENDETTEEAGEENGSSVFAKLSDHAQTREIEGFTYKVQPVPFEKSFPALMRLIRMLSPTLAAFFREKGLNLRVAAIFDRIPQILTDAEMKFYGDLFGSYSWVIDGEKEIPLITSNRNLHFNMRHLPYLRWILFAMEVNFAGFFGGIQNDQESLSIVLKGLNLSTESTGGNGSAGAS